MTYDTTRERRAPTRFGQKDKPIAVGDEVRARYAKTADYWLAKVLAIEDDGMTVQWEKEAVSATSHGGVRPDAGGRHENCRLAGVWGLRRLVCRRENDADLHLQHQDRWEVGSPAG